MFSAKRWAELLTLLEHAAKSAVKKDPNNAEWTNVVKQLESTKSQLQYAENALAFTFVEVR